MIVLGIDPGSRKAGFGLIQSIGRKIDYLHSQTAFFDSSKDVTARIPDIFKQTYDYVEKYQPSVIAIESLIYVKSPTALIKLAQARGAMLAAIFEQGYENKVFEYSPNLVKSQTTGHGHSDKLAGQKFLNTLIGKREYKTDDESDALLVAVCHAVHGSKVVIPKMGKKSKGSNSLASSLAHRIK